MECVKSWKNSLELFKPGNFKLFALVTLNAYWQLCKVVLWHWWFLAPLFLVLYGAVPIIAMQCLGLFRDCQYAYILGKLLAFALIGFLFLGINIVLFSFCLGTRASVQRKTTGYFVRYLINFWYLLFLCVAIDCTNIVVSAMILPPVLNFLFLPLLALEYIWKVIFMLFVVDSSSSFQSLLLAVRHATHFVWHNVPIMLLLLGFFSMQQYLRTLIYHIVIPGMLGGIFSVLWTVFFYSLLVVILATLYIKQIHDQSKYYFPQPS